MHQKALARLATDKLVIMVHQFRNLRRGGL
eukprot:SAG11_NODE_24439_length_373_cov_0.919708_1_plen_29_part_10